MNFYWTLLTFFLAGTVYTIRVLLYLMGFPLSFLEGIRQLGRLQYSYTVTGTQTVNWVVVLSRTTIAAQDIAASLQYGLYGPHVQRWTRLHI